MDLKEFDFPDLDDVAIAFSTLRTDPKLLAEARDRGFYSGHTKWNKMFSDLFSSGGQLKIKKDLPVEFKTKALKYLKAFMGSFAPKHEEKEAICALLLSEICE